MNKVVGILLAAGKSSRFGRNKCLALLPDQMAMGIHSAQKLSFQVDEMIVVIPPDNPALEALFSNEGYATTICQTAELGMSESLKTGVSYFATTEDSPADDHCPDTHTTAYLIALADMPLIKPETYQKVVRALKNDNSIVLPQYQDRRGHPVGFNANYRNELLALQGDQGAKVLLQKYEKVITLISVDDLGIHQDFDTRFLFEQFFHEHSR